MTINLSVPKQDNTLKPKITVIGVGGAGGNAVNNMINAKLEGVEFLIANTDAQSLVQSLSDRKIQLGQNITRGLGAGARPEIGRAAAEEAIEELSDHLIGTNMVFVTAGMGGGTGTGAAPVVARLAREQDILTLGVVTKPFHFEGVKRARIAEAGIQEMQQYVDTLIVIPNQNLFRVANEKTTFADAFAMADQVLHSGVRGITDLMVVPGLVNLDFADIRTVMSEMGKAMMGTGEAEGEQRATAAAEAAISNPLLDEVSMKGARGVLINITGGPDMTLFEVDEAANRIGQEVDSEASIIFGSTLDSTLGGCLRVSVVATGIDVEACAAVKPVLKVVSEAGGDAAAQAPVGAARPAAPVDAPAAEPRDDPEPRPGAALAMAAESIEHPPPREALDKNPAIDVRPGGIVGAWSDIDDPIEHPPLHEALDKNPAIDVRPGGTVSAWPDIAADDCVDEPEQQRRRSPSLFERMTGGGKTRRRREVAGHEPAFAPIDPVPESRSPASSPPLPSLGPKLGADAGVKPAAARAQPTFDDFVLEDTAPSVSGEDDFLDIPAFLRRQAN